MEKQSKNQTLYKLVVAALFAALIVVTIWLVHIPIGTTGGYFNLGDACIFLAASLLPWPYACGAAAVGGALADVLTGAPIWAPFTLVIKALIALCFTAKKETMLCKRNFAALPLAWVITIGGYYFAEAVLYGNWASPVASIPGNTMQIVISAVLYVIIALALDKAKLKERVNLK